MAPIFTLIIGKILDYLADHADEIIQLIREKFTSSKDPEVHAAIQRLGHEPSAENLTSLEELLKSKGEDVGELAKILVNETTVA